MQLHVVEELLELFDIDYLSDQAAAPMVDLPAETAMAISHHALTRGKSPKAIRLHAWLQGHEVLLLVDSGSSTSFIDARLAASLKGVVPLHRLCHVKVANGASSVVRHTFANAAGPRKLKNSL